MTESTTSAVAACGRAKLLFERIVDAASTGLSDAKSALRDLSVDDPTRPVLEAGYIACDKLLGHATDQLYFGSGAFKADEKKAPGLLNADAKRRFLREWEQTLARIAGAATPHTLHHLIGLYDYLIDADPGVVFDRVAAVVLGSRRPRPTSTRFWALTSWSRL